MADDARFQKAGKAFWSGTSRLIKTSRKYPTKYIVTGKKKKLIKPIVKIKRRKRRKRR